MFKNRIEPRTLLSTLWICFLCNMFLRDFHEFPTEGYIESMMELKLSAEVMLLYAFIGEIPILMIFLSRILSNKANKWTNIVAVIISSFGILYTIPSGQLDEIFFAVMNFGAFSIIIFTVLKLPSFDDN